MHHDWTGLLGMATVLALAYLFSTNRRAIRLKTVAWGLGLQVAFAFFVLDTRIGRAIFSVIGDAVNKLLDYSFYGSTFVFGELGKKSSQLGFYFAFQVLPTIIFIAALFAVLYHYGVMPFIVKQAAKVMTKLMAASGAESLNIAASIFMGQTEAPLTIRPFLPDVTRSELMCIMTSGMAHVSGGIMAAYIAFGVDAKHLITAVIMTAPGTLLLSKMLVPETETPITAGRVELAKLEKEPNGLGALSRGTIDGLHLALNVAAMLISFIAVIYLCDGILGGIHSWLAPHGFTRFPSSLEQIFGWMLSPIAWLIGVPWHDARKVGSLLGTRMVLNELIAYGNLGTMKTLLDPRSFTIATYALCGFANFSSIGIQIGGIGALAPNKKDELARLGLRAMLAGTMANLMSASIAGIMLK
ncbi:MAG TPA: nucleoside transporter C-terminal domain-containing protein [Candidatus Acidoferrales bacterium]|nr:nucleoside transporter C-terminal domain-containing protein [Candidatus Acidoferrales bacterium]